MAYHSSGSYNWHEKRSENERLDHLGRGLHIHQKIKVLIDGGIIETTPGRVIFNTIVPKELGFQNYVLRKKEALRTRSRVLQENRLGDDRPLLG